MQTEEKIKNWVNLQLNKYWLKWIGLLVYFNLDENRLNQLLINYNEIIKGKYSKPVSRLSLDARSKISHEYINSVDKYLENSHNRRVIISQIKRFMELYQDLKNFRLYNMKKILKIFFNYRYKILHGIHP